MHPLKETKVYIPIDVDVELPKENGDYIARISEIRDVEIIKYCKQVSYDAERNMWFDGRVRIKVTHWLKEQTGYFLNNQEMLLFKRQFALEVINKIRTQGDVMAWSNIKKELQAEFENKLLNNE